MTEVSAFDAKTHFSRLLKRARDGEEITITLHGQPVARLGPLEPGNRSDAVQAMEEVLAIRQELAVAGKGMSRDDIVALVHEGRARAMERATSGLGGTGKRKR